MFSKIGVTTSPKPYRRARLANRATNSIHRSDSGGRTSRVPTGARKASRSAGIAECYPGGRENPGVIRASLHAQRYATGTLFSAQVATPHDDATGSRNFGGDRYFKRWSYTYCFT